MSEQIVKSDSTPATHIDYQPLSLLAILGVTCAGLYAVIVLVSAVTAVFGGTPLFLPTWLLLLPLVGAALCLIAQRQIKNSEDTLAGDTLTKWGLWLAVLSGLGYGAYFFATGLAIQQQANRFMLEKGKHTGFFAHLLEGDPKRAFLLTMRWHQRRNINADSRKEMSRFTQPVDLKNPKGSLGAFLDTGVIQIAMQAGREGNPIEPLGVKDWKYGQGEYTISRTYRIKTKEITLDVLATVQSNDTDAPGETRKWSLIWPLQVVDMKVTPLGEAADEMREQASRVIRSWLLSLERGNLKTTSKNSTNWAEVSIPVEAHRDLLKKKLTKILSGEPPLQVMPDFSEYVPWREKSGHVQLDFHPLLLIAIKPGTETLNYLAELKVVVQSKEPLQPLEVSEETQWEVARVEVIACRLVPKEF